MADYGSQRGTPAAYGKGTTGTGRFERPGAIDVLSVTTAQAVEWLAAYIADVEHKRVYQNRLEHAATALDDLRKLARTQPADPDGWRILTKAQVRRRLYDEENQTDGRSVSVRRWLRDWVKVGLLELDVATVGTGKKVGLRFRFVPLTSGVPAGVAQSVETTASCGWRQRRETDRQRRAASVAPYRRRAGRGSHRRFERCTPGRSRPEPPSSSSKRFAPSRTPPKGGVSEQQQTRERACEPPAWLAALKPWLSDGTPQMTGRWVDAIERACPPGQLPALRTLRTASMRAGVAWPDALTAAAEAGAPPTAVALAAWEQARPGLEPRLSRRSQAQLERSAGQLDRINRRPVGAADLVADLADGDWRYDRDTEPQTLAYFVAGLKQQARAVRRTMRGAPAPRPWKARGRA